MKIGTITFHGAHNYGSVLQAYALQEYVKIYCEEKGIPCEYNIINFRTKFQKEIYGVVPARSIKRKVKRLLLLPFKLKLGKQREKFEKFINENLNITDEIYDEKQLERYSNTYDVYISGGDQIWNIRTGDFSFAYLLNFTSKKKISYSVSCGPMDIDWRKYDKDSYAKLLEEYDLISVREESSKRIIDNLLGDDLCKVHLDPTMLLSRDKWRALESNYNYNNGKYILFYCLEQNKKTINVAKRFSQKYGLPIVIPTSRNKYDYLNFFAKCQDAGPKDFLSLVDRSKLVLTSSFHGTLFSIIYNKPFYVINGMQDNRISNILRLTGLEARSMDINANIFTMDECEIDWTMVNKMISDNVLFSKAFFKEALSI